MPDAKTPARTTAKTKAASSAQAKTTATLASVAEHLAARAKGPQIADCAALLALLQRVTGEPARMWGPSIVGFGAYSYRYESGREGTSCLTGFAVRGADLVVYLGAEGPQQAARLARLGKHKMGKACLYFKRLSDLDLAVLEQLVAHSVAELRRLERPPRIASVPGAPSAP